MPAIDFPAAPAVNDEYSFEGRTWRWNGTGWEVKEYPAALLAGTAANPSLYFSGDPNTGLYSPGADQVAVATNGSQRLLINSGGITSANGGVFSGDVTSYGVDGLALTFNSTNSEIRACRSGGNYSNLLFFTQGANSGGVQAERVRITTEGLVGIGASSAPGNLNSRMWIDQAGTNDYGLLINASGGVKIPTLWFRDASGALPGKIVGQASLQLATASSATTALTIDASQRVGIGTTSPGTILAINDPGTGLGFTNAASGNFNLGLLGGTGSNEAFIYQRANGPLRFGTNNTERARIDSSGRLLVGQTTNPDGYYLIVNTGSGSNNNAVQLSNNADADLRINLTSGVSLINANTGILALGTSGTERARIDSSGRLLVGTSTARVSANGVSAGLQVEGLGAEGALSIIRNGGLAYLTLGRSGGASIGSNTAISNNDELGRISWAAADGTDIQSWAAQISAEIDGTPGANDVPGRLVFSTTADGAPSPTEAMRINNQRELLIGTTTRTANGGVLQISNGITFPGTQSACSDANTLDDYEEGTFTPTVEGSSTAGTVTYGIRNGKYTKTGNVVYFSLYLSWSAGTGTGNLVITGLPFTPSTGTTFPSCAIEPGALVLSANNVVGAHVDNSQARVVITQYPVGGGGNTNVAYDASVDLLLIGGFYQTA